MPSERAFMIWRWMNSVAPMSTPRVGWDATRSLGLGGQLPGHHRLLLVAAGQGVRRRVLRRRADVELRDDLPRRFPDCPRVHQLQPRGERRLVVTPEGEVRGEGEGEEQAVLQPVLGDVGDALLPPPAARSSAAWMHAFQEDVAGLDLRSLRDGVHQLALAVALHAGDAVDLPGPHGEGEAVHARDTRGRSRTLRSRTSRTVRPGSSAGRSTSMRTGFPTISSAIMRLGDARAVHGPHDLPLADHGDPVRDREHLVQLVA